MQLEAYLQHDDRIVLPIGSTEQHAYLSLATDNILAERWPSKPPSRWACWGAARVRIGLVERQVDEPDGEGSREQHQEDREQAEAEQRVARRVLPGRLARWDVRFGGPLTHTSTVSSAIATKSRAR